MCIVWKQRVGVKIFINKRSRCKIFNPFLDVNSRIISRKEFIGLKITCMFLDTI